MTKPLAQEMADRLKALVGATITRTVFADPDVGAPEGSFGVGVKLPDGRNAVLWIDSQADGEGNAAPGVVTVDIEDPKEGR